eukprot:g4201.t1
MSSLHEMIMEILSPRTKEERQCSIVDEMFEVWYSSARRFAAGEMPAEEMARVSEEALTALLGGKGGIEHLATASLDRQAGRNLVATAGKIIMLHRSKPKFFKLWCGSKDLRDAVAGDVGKRIEAIIMYHRFPESIRVEAVRTLQELLQLYDMQPASDEKSREKYRYDIDASRLVTLLTNVKCEMNIRSEGFEMLRFCNDDQRRKVARILVEAAQDNEALLAAWKMGALNMQDCVNIILHRVRRQKQRKDLASHDQQFDCDVTQSFIGAVLDSIREAALNDRSSGRSAELIDHSKVFREGNEHLCVLLQACDEASKSAFVEYSSAEGTTEREHSQEFLEVLGTLIESFPENVGYIELAINPPSLEGLKPMSIRGISGRPLEQEAIDLLRECARLHYMTKTSQNPSASLGNRIWITILEAMRRGYIETEGFPAILVEILISHHFENPEETSEWIRHALKDTICHNHKMKRAVHEALMSAVGLESSAWGVSLRALSKQGKSWLLSVISSCTSLAALGFWETLCTSYPEFLREHEDVVLQVLLTIDEQIRGNVERRAANVQWWVSTARCLRALAECIESTSSPLFFDLTLQVIALCPAGEGDTLASMYGDETLARIVQNFNGDAKLSHGAVEEAIRRGGERTRSALARIEPVLFLRDQTMSTRLAALQAIQKAPEVVITHADTIMNSCDEIIRRRENVEAHVHLSDFAEAAAPLFALISKTFPAQYLAMALDGLSKAAQSSKSDSPHSEASTVIVHALNTICDDVEDDDLLFFCLDKDHADAIFLLKTISPSWEKFLNAMVDCGKLEVVKSRRRGRSSLGNVYTHGPNLDVDAIVDRHNSQKQRLPVLQGFVLPEDSFGQKGEARGIVAEQVNFMHNPCSEANEANSQSKMSTAISARVNASASTWERLRVLRSDTSEAGAWKWHSGKGEEGAYSSKYDEEQLPVAEAVFDMGILPDSVPSFKR